MINAVGKDKIWSEMYNTAEVQKEIEIIKGKLKRKAFWMLFLTPLIGTIYGFIMQMAEVDEMRWWHGLLLSTPLEIIFIYHIIRKMIIVNKKPFEGTVIKKKTYMKSKRSWIVSFFFGGRSEGSHVSDEGQHYDMYEIQIRTTNGSKKKIAFRDDMTYYDYVKENDIVRYYPLFDTLEKYDKSKANKTYCIVCGEENPIINVRCPNCGHRLYSVVEENTASESKKPIKQKKQAAEDEEDLVWNGEKITMADLMTKDYCNHEEAGEAYYDNEWDKDDPSWQCDCGAWNEDKFCGNCSKSN